MGRRQVDLLELFEHRVVRLPGFVAMWAKPFDSAWFRLFGYGLALADHRVSPPLFSERYNGRHGVRKRFYLHVGPWCIKFLRPRRR
jgi:hypothetical protein